jgi:hypothetical protein
MKMFLAPGLFVLAATMFAAATQSARGQCLPSSGTKLPHFGGGANDNLGGAVAVFGERVLMGAIGDADAGSFSGGAYVVRRVGQVYVHEARLPAAGLAASSRFGSAVAMNDTIAVIGAAGHLGTGAVFVFRRTGSTWTQEHVLTALDGAANDSFGNAVSLSGDRILIGAVGDADLGSNTGSAYIFRFNGVSWAQETKLTSSNAALFAFYGISVSISGTRALVGSRDGIGGASGSGAVYAYAFNGSAWVQEQRIDAPDAATSDAFGCSVSLEGDLALIGARADDDGGSNTGSAYLFRRSGGVWLQEAKLNAPDPGASDFFGNSVSLSGTFAAIGATGDDTTAADVGSAYLFARIAGAWSLVQKLNALDGLASDGFGTVAVSSGRLAIGASFDDDLGTSSGSVSLFFLAPTLSIDRQPADTATTAGQRTTLSVLATGPLLTSYQWRKSGSPLTDGPALGGGQIIGAQSNALVFSAAGSPDAGIYDCVVTSPCGEAVTTNPVLLSVSLASCAGDSDRNGVVNFSDITSVLANFGAACP